MPRHPRLPSPKVHAPSPSGSETLQTSKRAGFTEGIALSDYDAKEIGLTLGVAGETAPEDTDALKAQTTSDQTDLTCGKWVMESLVGFTVLTVDDTNRDHRL
ncbi:hypothetical protein NEUTE1DRAFT_138156 [Neurospora tetrasperma FGSC 2508]|uniref:Uncharacterized protein n=1 Tax=Neurospora tetrasperma (strain FGSC 2508 / ATCC MYA-4615 / P0657) TaxID=510951 RepID=F8MLK8_NEUT8|nr:uncharacterized protein NEUTE1DRAFT_138156 [Neurospora tetrasperma FGSC 2508]EGO58427.1 hypothetical protein NEUTE1DRAFT_138156 [Neurospora tetrasperma FGSC 2508]